MIHFNFVVEDVDAENIFDCINSEINNCNRRKLLINTTKEEIVWYNKHIEYLKNMKKKMKNHKAVFKTEHSCPQCKRFVSPCRCDSEPYEDPYS
jgi:hypothetical protein